MLAILTLLAIVSNAPNTDGPEAPRGSWTGTALQEPRRGHTATLLRDGRVLLVGGGACEDRAWPSGARSVEIFDPSSARSEQLPQLLVPRREHATVTMKGGRVAVLGGVSGATRPDGASAAVEILALDRGHGGAAMAWT